MNSPALIPLATFLFAGAALLPNAPQSTEVEAATPLPTDKEEQPPSAIYFAPETPEVVKAALREQYSGSGNQEFTLSGSTWPGSQPGTPFELTWSLVPDGTPGSQSNMFALLDAQFTAAGFADPRAAWIQIIQDAFDRWDELSGVNFTRITVNGDADNGQAWGLAGVPGLAGDIRIRTWPAPGGGLAFTVAPGTGFAAGEISLTNMVDWTNPAPGFPYIFENAMMHSIGHAIGLDFVCPTIFTKLMEPISGGQFYGPQHDDVRGAHSLYGDPYEPNETRQEAPLILLPTLINEFDLSAIDDTNGPFGPGSIDSGRLSIDAPNDVDVFALQWNEPVGVQVRARNVGHLYADDDCVSVGNFTNSETIANLKIELLDRTGQVLDSSTSGIVSQQFSDIGVPYYVRVSALTPIFAEPQAYSLDFWVNPGIPCTSSSIVCDDLDATNGAESCNGVGCVVTYTSDCNNNYIEDAYDIAWGTSADCNNNGLPDECEADCNGNGLADSCDIANGTSSDLNANGIPDECEDDCNGNGIPDSSELNGTTDQNDNGVLDECETDRFVPYDAGTPNSYATISAALIASNPGDTIYIAPGTYAGPGNRNLEIVDQTVQIIGAGADQTTIDLELSGRFAFLAKTTGENRTRIEGLRILGGFVDGNTPLGGGSGGAIYLHGADAKIERCIFERNVAQNSGGACWIERSSVDQRIRSCIFFDNAASSAGAIGSYDLNLPPKVINCTLADNVSGAGSAIWTLGGIELTSCIVRSNNASGGTQLLIDDPSTSTVSYSNLPNAELAFWQGMGQVGNIATAAKFVNRPGNDYHIKSASPCRNAGDPNASPTLSSPMDIDGERRVLEGHIDMGADEFSLTQGVFQQP